MLDYALYEKVPLTQWHDKLKSHKTCWALRNHYNQVHPNVITLIAFLSHLLIFKLNPHYVHLLPLKPLPNCPLNMQLIAHLHTFMSLHLNVNFAFLSSLNPQNVMHVVNNMTFGETILFNTLKIIKLHFITVSVTLFTLSSHTLQPMHTLPQLTQP